MRQSLAKAHPRDAIYAPAKEALGACKFSMGFGEVRLVRRASDVCDILGCGNDDHSILLAEHCKYGLVLSSQCLSTRATA